MKISIIIVNWNTKDLLRGCLESVYQNPPQGEFEVFIIDNASTDGSPEMVEKEFPQVKLIKNKENVGFAKANNQAIKLAQGKYILLLNSDTEILPNAFDEMLSLMDKNPKIGVLGCQLLNRDGSIQDSCGYFPSITATLFTKVQRASMVGRLFKRLPSSQQKVEKEKEVDWVTGACLMVRKEAIEKVELLDEKMFMYFEDNDWCWRFKKAGWKVYVTPKAKVIHHSGASLRKASKRIILDYRKSQYRLYKKHLSWFSLLMLKFSVRIHALGKICFLKLASSLKKEPSAKIEELNYYKKILSLS